MFVSGIAEIAQDIRDLEAGMSAVLHKIGAYDRAASYTTDGYTNTAVALRVTCRLDHGVAAGHVKLARKLDLLPDVAEAFAAGDISRAHAAVIADAHTPERASQLTPIEPQFVEIARQHPPRTLRGFVRRVVDAIDGDGGAASDDKQHARRRLHLSKTFDGMYAVDGFYDPADGAFLERALQTEMERDHLAHDPRPVAQRRADALLHLVRRGHLRGETGTARAVREHFSVAIDLYDLPGASHPDIDRIRTEARHYGHLSAATLARLTCDCDISRVITAGPSEILDVGRTTRTIPPALWKALVIRDRHCQHPGCDRPPPDCEAHHLRHWSQGGPTSLDNLKLYCWPHHTEQHQHTAHARAG